MKIRTKHLWKATVLGIFLLNSDIALSQPKQEYNDMTKFDIQAFEQNKKGDNWNQTFADGTTIRQSWLSSTGYLVEISNSKNPYSESKVFNFQGELVLTGQFFHTFPIGTTIKYDGKGNIINKTNHDQAFPFSLDQVIKKMRTEFNLDMMNREAVPIVSRSADQTIVPFPYYIVYATDAANHQLTGYLIHGATGEVLLTKATDIYGNDGWILKSYAETLNQKKLKQK